jgi:hypothetical protein
MILGVPLPWQTTTEAHAHCLGALRVDYLLENGAVTSRAFGNDSAEHHVILVPLCLVTNEPVPFVAVDYLQDFRVTTFMAYAPLLWLSVLKASIISRFSNSVSHWLR